MRIRAFAALAALSATLGCGAWKRFAYEGIGRDAWQKPDSVISLLEIAPGAEVADLGAGGGYFTFRLADAVGPGGRVYAVDVDDDMIELLRDRVAAEGRANLLFTCDTYHHLTDRSAYFAKLRTDLAPGARVAILDLNDRSTFARLFGHGTAKQTIVDELTAAGYRLVADHEGVIDRQNFLVFDVAR
jgi:arsenite methyltransferase